MPCCPCDSGLDYAACCDGFHRGVELPATAEKLMRSRYSAYVLKHSSYLHDTWHLSTRPAALDISTDETLWLGLTILGCEQGGEHDSEGRVEFVAHYRGGQLHEKSRFIREGGRWFYLDGAILPPVAVTKPGRNEPCPCGSGKKYKKCCGNS